MEENWKYFVFTICTWPNWPVKAKKLLRFQFEGKTDVWIKQVRLQKTNEKVKVVLLLPLFTSSSKRLAPVLPSRSEKLSRYPLDVYFLKVAKFRFSFYSTFLAGSLEPASSMNHPFNFFLRLQLQIKRLLGLGLPDK